MGDNVFRFIGDLSSRDSYILARYAKISDGILEFGMGGSTQIFSQSKRRDCRLYCVETDKQWVELTINNLNKLGTSEPNIIFNWEEYLTFSGSSLKSKRRLLPIDMILVDGIDNLRLNFAISSWNLLTPGGNILFHDTKREKDVGNVLELAKIYHKEVDKIVFNIETSNITSITKKTNENYYDWNKLENKKSWQIGYSEPPIEFSN